MNEHPENLLKKLYDNQQFEQIISYCNEQIEIEKSNYLFFGARGKAFYELNELQKATFDFSEALSLSPNYVKGLFNRALCYSDLEEYPLAINDIKKAHSLNRDETFYDFLGIFYSMNNDYTSAIENFNLYLTDSLDKEILKWRAEAYFHLGQFKKAIKDYETILLAELEDNDVLNKIEKINSFTFDDYPVNKAFQNRSTISFEDYGFRILNDERTSGIYILEFSNGEYYVGQTKQIHSRLIQHKKKIKDIKNVYFKAIVESDLLSDENKTIAFFESNLLRIRNLKQIEFKNIFNDIHQKLWLSDLNYNYISGYKFENEIVRQKFSSRYKILQEQIYFTRLVPFLASYLKYLIPNYLASEYNYWNITCLPKYLVKENCIARININAVPVLSVYLNANHSLYVMMYISKLPFLKHLNLNLNLDGIFDKIPSLKMEIRNAFEVTESDEITVFVEEEDFKNLLNNELLLSAIRLFNLRMMNKIGKEERYRRTVSHCLDLSDHIIKNIY